MGKDPQWYDAQVSEDTTLPDCVRQTGMVPNASLPGQQKKEWLYRRAMQGCCYEILLPGQRII